MQFQMSKAVGIYPLPVTAMPTEEVTAHSCLLPVPQTASYEALFTEIVFISVKNEATAPM